jgi:hypothetical protein
MKAFKSHGNYDTGFGHEEHKAKWGGGGAPAMPLGMGQQGPGSTDA